MIGFVYTWRTLRNHWLWRNKPFARGQAWIDLIMRAAYSPHIFRYKGFSLPVEQKRGEVSTSLRELSDTWGWSIGKTKRFLDVLKTEQMAEYKTERIRTVITLCNYDTYQHLIGQNGTQTEHKTERKRNANGTPTETINNTNKRNKKNIVVGRDTAKAVPCPPDNKINLDKNGQWHNITNNHLTRWTDAYPGLSIESELKRISTYYLANPKKWRINWERAIINWLTIGQDRVKNAIGKEESPQMTKTERKPCPLCDGQGQKVLKKGEPSVVCPQCKGKKYIVETLAIR